MSESFVRVGQYIINLNNVLYISTRGGDKKDDQFRVFIHFGHPEGMYENVVELMREEAEVFLAFMIERSYPAEQEEWR